MTHLYVNKENREETITMDKRQLKDLLVLVKEGTLSVSDAVSQIGSTSMAEIEDYSKLDLSREKRTGFPEVIFGEGKTAEQITAIFERLIQHGDRVMATRITPENAEQVQSRLSGLTYASRARILYFDKNPVPNKRTGVTVISAGTADVPVADEAALTAELMGNQVECIYDVGVAGLHRMLNYLPNLQQANVLIVVAGMEGALASVVGGLVSCPIIAVPTSVGYGASFHGVAALLAMLNSCAGGVSVVNIDNGFGAGVIASRINRLAGKQE